MRLTRRDALAALAAAGVGAGAVGAGAAGLDPGDAADALPGVGEGENDGDGDRPDRRLDDRERRTAVALAVVLYPSAVENVEGFVRSYLDGAVRRPGYAAGASEAIADLDDLGRSWYGGRVVELDRATRDELLRSVGADTADPDPEGSPAERVRYYLVDELLFALYASPTGGRLVGIENPQGHPGGLDSYRRGPR